MGQAQADVTMVNQGLGHLVAMTMTTNPDSDPVLFGGNASDLIRERVIELFVQIPQSALAALSVSQSDDGLTLMDEDGESTAYTIESFSSQTAIEGRYDINSGVYSDFEDSATTLWFPQILSQLLSGFSVLVRWHVFSPSASRP